ncbi:MAG: beta-ketoacyl synthase N-terminal-like domain-containing protein [Anaerolineaceae bacterium]|nr:beta-ketoacyl synthase N-terminal-like domain-containing protein [Anaerolineaceae bacterium]
MTDVVIAGIGQTPVGEHWDVSLRDLAERAMLAAIADAGGLRPDALYVGNFLSPVVSHQANLGALLVDHAGLNGIEAFTVEAAGASGAGALHMGYLAVASGYVDAALVIGVEKYTDQTGSELETAIAQSMDNDYEAVHGLTPTGQAALLMQRYLHDCDVPRQALGAFALIAHANGTGNPNAMYRKAIRPETYARAGLVSDPLNLFDVAPYADGAAAALLTRPELLPEAARARLVRVSGSSVAIDRLALHDRPDPLAFEAAGVSLQRACRQAGILPGDVDFFELCDAYSIYAALSLEAAGFARRGEGWRLAERGELNLDGRLPISTLGGLKARGNPLGAAGLYQAVEAVQQLRGEAGANQLAHPRRALVQSLGGPAATAVTHVLERLN